VVDLRGDDNVAGDVLVLAAEGRGALGVAVDKVVAVLADDALTLDDAPLAEEMPSYVEGVLRGANGLPVLLVQVARFAGMGEAHPAGRIPQPRRTASPGSRPA
jgi:chemotaxis signal transduction protein